MARLTSDLQRRIEIQPWQPRRLSELADTTTYDASLTSVGYEPRSYAIAQHLGADKLHSLAVGFRDQRNDRYFETEKWYRGAGYHISDSWDERFMPTVQQWLLDVSAAGATRVAVDVSSMSRPRIAAVAQLVAQLPGNTPLELHFLYSPAQFRPPGDLPTGVLSLAPVSQYFAGVLQTRNVPQPVVGLGYEPFKAAGALESLEVRDPILYIPTGFDDRFRPAVLEANDGLIHSHEKPALVDYEVSDPFELYALLEGQLQSLLSAGRAPAIIPLGPKIFALCACLAAASHHPRVSVWRASFDQDEPATPHEADDWVCGIIVTRGPADPPIDRLDNPENDSFS